jgi:hypothetical protein
MIVMGVSAEDGVEKIQLIGGDGGVIEALPDDGAGAIPVDVVAQLGINGQIVAALSDDEALLSEIPKSRLLFRQRGAQNVFLIHDANPSVLSKWVLTIISKLDIIIISKIDIIVKSNVKKGVEPWRKDISRRGRRSRIPWRRFSP